MAARTPNAVVCIIVGTLSTWLAACAARPIDDDSPRHVASASCPLKTPSDWQRFLDQTTENESWVATCSDLDNCDALVGPFAAEVQSGVIDVLALCASDLADNPAIAACTANLRRFVPAWMNQHGDSYGFRQDNKTYFVAQTGPDSPVGMMEPPPALLAALRDRATIEEAAGTNGWPYLTHDSGLGGVRTVVTVADPEDRFDQWINVGYDVDTGLVPSPGIMSFIGVQKRDAGGRRLERVRLHFRDYVVTRAQGSYTLDLPETLDGKCYACHTSGMRPLVPMRGSVAASAPVRGEPGYGDAGAASDDFGVGRLSSLNQRLLSYGPPDWNGTVEPADHGPPLGQGLGCPSCHDGVSRGVVTVSTSEGMLAQKIVDQLSMRSGRGGKSVPDLAAMALLQRDNWGNPPLSPLEKGELDRARADHLADYEALVADRFPAWKAWARNQPCE